MNSVNKIKLQKANLLYILQTKQSKRYYKFLWFCWISQTGDTISANITVLKKNPSCYFKYIIGFSNKNLLYRKSLLDNNNREKKMHDTTKRHLCESIVRFKNK